MVIFLRGCDAESFTKRDEDALWRKENSASFSALDKGIFDNFAVLKEMLHSKADSSREPLGTQMYQHQAKS